VVARTINPRGIARCDHRRYAYPRDESCEPAASVNIMTPFFRRIAGGGQTQSHWRKTPRALFRMPDSKYLLGNTLGGILGGEETATRRKFSGPGSLVPVFLPHISKSFWMRGVLRGRAHGGRAMKGA